MPKFSKPITLPNGSYATICHNFITDPTADLLQTNWYIDPTKPHRSPREHNSCTGPSRGRQGMGDLQCALANELSAKQRFS